MNLVTSAATNPIAGERVMVFRISCEARINGSFELIHWPTSVPLAQMSSRRQNETKFGRWEDLPDGGRRYRLDVTGRFGWLARYLKEVDAKENTIRFWQEIYDDTGKLVEIHEKFPVDKGH